MVEIEIRDPSSTSGDPGARARNAIGLSSTLAPADVPGPVIVRAQIDPGEITPERFVRERVEDPLDKKDQGLRQRLVITVRVDGSPLGPQAASA